MSSLVFLPVALCWWAKKIIIIMKTTTAMADIGSTESESPHRCCHSPNNSGQRWIFPIFYNGSGDGPENCQFPCWYLGPHLIHGSFGTKRPNPKQHLERFSRFSTAHSHEQQTDTQTVVSQTTGYILSFLRCGQ